MFRGRMFLSLISSNPAKGVGEINKGWTGSPLDRQALANDVDLCVENVRGGHQVGSDQQDENVAGKQFFLDRAVPVVPDHHLDITPNFEETSTLSRAKEFAHEAVPPSFAAGGLFRLVRMRVADENDGLLRHGVFPPYGRSTATVRSWAQRVKHARPKTHGSEARLTNDVVARPESLALRYRSFKDVWT